MSTCSDEMMDFELTVLMLELHGLIDTGNWVHLIGIMWLRGEGLFMPVQSWAIQGHLNASVLVLGKAIRHVIWLVTINQCCAGHLVCLYLQVIHAPSTGIPYSSIKSA